MCVGRKYPEEAGPFLYVLFRSDPSDLAHSHESLIIFRLGYHEYVNLLSYLRTIAVAYAHHDNNVG